MELNELGSGIDRLYELRSSRLELQREVDELKSKETEQREAILNCLALAGLSKASGGLATASIKRSTIPVVTDWEQVHNYIRRENRFDLLQKRISVIAWRELYQDDVLIPGTDAVEDEDLSLTKASRG